MFLVICDSNLQCLSHFDSSKSVKIGFEFLYENSLPLVCILTTSNDFKDAFVPVIAGRISAKCFMQFPVLTFVDRT